MPEPSIHPFAHVAAYRVVICTQCRYAVIGDEAESHLRGKYGMPGKEASRIGRDVQALPGIITERSDLCEFTFPMPEVAEIPVSQPAKKDGLACTKCTYVCRDVQWMRDHYKTEHQWQNPRKQGRPQAPVEMPWRVGVQCQRFFKSREASGWFEVGRQPGPRQHGGQGSRRRRTGCCR